MGIIVNKSDDKNTELNRRITTELREKAQKASEINADPDLAEDSEYVEQFKKTSKFGWVWIVLIVLAILSLIFIIFF